MMGTKDDGGVLAAVAVLQLVVKVLVIAVTASVVLVVMVLLMPNWAAGRIENTTAMEPPWEM